MGRRKLGWALLVGVSALLVAMNVVTVGAAKQAQATTADSAATLVVKGAVMFPAAAALALWLLAFIFLREPEGY